MRSVTRKIRKSDTEGGLTTAEHVINTLEQLLIDGESFTSLSIDHLAKKAGIARATFYLHFRNKGELVGLLMKRVGKEMRIAARDSMADLDQFGRADFLKFMEHAIEVQYRHRAAIRAVIETSFYDPAVAKIYQSFMSQMIGDTRHFIVRLQAAGQAHPDAGPELAEVLTWAAERCCNQMLKNNDSEANRHHLASLLTHVVWNSIAAF
jgi:AcrR family transcriptional regulator